MKCIDCEIDYDEKIITKRNTQNKGRCIYCGRIYNTAVSKGLDYVPWRIKKRAFPEKFEKFRKLHEKSIIKETEKKIEKETQEKPEREEFKFTSANEVIDVIDKFIKLINNDYEEELEREIRGYNSLSLDYLHFIEIKEGKELEDIQRRQKELLTKRRTAKTNLNIYKDLKPCLEQLKDNNELYLILNNIKNIIKSKENANNFKTFNKIDDEHEVYKKYRVSVPVWNLHGNRGMDIFESNKPTYAQNEEQAKSIFIKFIDNYFPALAYKVNDIKVEEINDDE